MQDVLIVGGGVVGLSLARALARVGAQVTLLERAEATGDSWPCAGASALPVALLNPWRGRKGDAHPEDLTGLATTWRWAEELTAEGHDPGADRTGVLRVATSERQARMWQDRAADVPSLAWWATDAVPSGVHAPFGALMVQDGGQLRADAWRTALASSARGHGATLRTSSEVARLTPAPDGWRAELRAGGAESARTVLLAIGADAPPTIDGCDEQNGGDAGQGGQEPAWPDWIRTRGEEVAVPVSAGPPMPVAGAIYAGSDGTRTWIGGGHRPADQEDPQAPENLRSALAWSVPGVAHAEIQAVWSGVRAKRADARPDVRRWREGAWIVGAFAGRGFLCAASEAERMATRWQAGEL